MENRVESVQGVYVPFWLFNALAEGYATFEATKSVRKRSGKSSYTVIYHYFIDRDGSLAFKNIPVDGSEKMDDEYMDAIEPFNYSQIKEFHPSYLAGYVAEKYDVDAQKSKWRAEYRMETTVDELCRDTIHGYRSVTLLKSKIKVKKGKVSYALLPVWILKTVYDSDDYLFMMNGQTGKLVGRLPVDKGKAWKYGAIFASALCALVTPILQCLNTWGVFMYIISLLVMVVSEQAGKELLNTTKSLPLPMVIIMSVALSVFAGHRIVRGWIRNMDTAKGQTEASEYVVPGSFRLR